MELMDGKLIDKMMTYDDYIEWKSANGMK